MICCFFMAEKYSICMYTTFPIGSHLDRIYIVAIVTSTVMDTGIQVSLLYADFDCFKCLLSSGIVDHIVVLFI